MNDQRATLISEPFVAVRPDGQRQSFQIMIYAPEAAREKNPWWWLCSVTLKPLYRGETRHGGATPFHALAAAVAHATGLLSSFAASGGKILRPSGEEVGVPSLKSGWHAGNDAG